jgi:hypothetical protein
VSDSTDNPRDILKPLDESMPHAPIAPAHTIAGLALTLALKYHDIGTVQDGTLYQQYKLEGKNLQPLHLDHVFETAIRMEAHLIASEKRIAALIIDALEVMVEEDEKGDDKAPMPEGEGS